MQRIMGYILNSAIDGEFSCLQISVHNVFCIVLFVWLVHVIHCFTNDFELFKRQKKGIKKMAASVYHAREVIRLSRKLI